MVDHNRVLVGDVAEVCEKGGQVPECLLLTELAGNFALGSLPGLPTRATPRRFMEERAPKD